MEQGASLGGEVHQEVPSEISNELRHAQVIVELSPKSLLVIEGGASCFYSVYFKSKYTPKEPVVLTPWALSSKIKIYPSMLLFRPDNIHKPQCFRVTAFENNAPDGADQIIEHRANSIDPCFSGSQVHFYPKHLIVQTIRNDGKHVFSAGDSQSGELGLGSQNFSYTFKEIPSVHFNVGSNNDERSASTMHVRRPLLSKVASGKHHTHVIDGSGQLFSFGNSDKGQLGLGEMNNSNKPMALNDFNTKNCCHACIKDVACGAEHSIAFTRDDDALTWGNNDFSQLGTHHSASNTPINLQLPMRCKIAQVACGAMHSVLLMAEGVVLAWGYGKSGALGHGASRTNVPSPMRVESLAKLHIFHVSCGDMHTAVISSSGDLYTAGWCEYGRLGRTTSNDCSPVFEKVNLKQRKCTYVACGGAHTLLLTDDRKVFAFGANQYGQLGVGDCRDRLYPTQLIFFQGISICRLQLGQNHSLAISEDNILYAWGNGEQGQCGIGDYPQIYTLPSLVKSLLGCKVMQVAAGNAFSIAVTIYTPEIVQIQQQENKDLAKQAKQIIHEDISRRERIRQVIRARQQCQESYRPFDCKRLLDCQVKPEATTSKDSEITPAMPNPLLYAKNHTTSFQRALKSALSTRRPRSGLACCIGRTSASIATREPKTSPKAKASWIIARQSTMHKSPTLSVLRPKSPPPPYPR